MESIKVESIWSYPVVSFVEGQIIYLNFPEIWRRVKPRAKKHPIERLIDYISGCIQHESTHVAVEMQTMELDLWWSEYGEEVVVRSMCNEFFPKNAQVYYDKE